MEHEAPRDVQPGVDGPGLARDTGAGFPVGPSMRVISLSLPCLLLLGCAAAPPEQASEEPVAAVEEQVSTKTASTSDYVCSNAPATGSHITRRRCMTRADARRVSEESKAWMRTGGVAGSPYVVPDAADPRLTPGSEDR
jgi:hypothetical protein